MMVCPYCYNPLSSETNDQRIYDRCLIRVGELEAENEKLRELVRKEGVWREREQESAMKPTSDERREVADEWDDGEEEGKEGEGEHR